jgi:CheY-like chemotaxis protein
MRILVVDDEPLVLKVMRRMLEGHDVVTAPTGIDALARYEPSVEAAIIDEHLPDMGGLEVAAFLRSKDPRLRIIITGGDLPVAALPYPRLAKPFTGEELCAALKNP